MVWYTVERCVFLYESYAKCGYTRKYQRKFHCKFPGTTVPTTIGILELTNEVRSTGSLLDKKPAKKKWCVLTEEKLDEIRARLEYTPQKSWDTLNKRLASQNLWISTYLNGIESVCVCRDIIFSISYNIGKLILLFLWSDTCLILGESCSAWQWVMHFLSGARKWQLCSNLSVNLLYKTGV
jgi:hypothetical protein